MSYREKETTIETKVVTHKTEVVKFPKHRKNIKGIENIKDKTEVDPIERLTIPMPVWLYDDLEKFAKNQRRTSGKYRSMAAVARVAITEYLKKHGRNYEYH